MISVQEHYVAWAGLLTELDEAREHLEALVKTMSDAGSIEESVFAVNLGHVFAHLNRAWHSCKEPTQVSEQQWEVFSAFPKDLKPVG